MIARVGTAIVAASLAAAGPIVATSPEPRAAAWAVHISIVSPAGNVLEAAKVSSEAGRSSRASGSPLMIAGQDPNGVSATPLDPDASKSIKDYDDPTGSSTFRAGFADAHATEASSQARAGFGSFNASGFAMANKLFTFDQQKQLLDQWQQTNDAIIGPLNESLAALDPLLSATGLKAPRLAGIPATGLIDVIKASQVSSTADTGSSPGFASARASTTIGDLRLFGGFIEAHSVSAEAVSESVSGDDTREATARIGSLSIAGINVVADSDGFRVVGNNLLPSDMLQPALDALLDALEPTGLTIKAVDHRSSGDLREATALEVSLASPQGAMVISIAHAEASAATVSAPVVNEPAPPSRTAVLPPLPPAAGTDVTPVPSRAPAPVGEPTAPASVSAGPLMRSYGAAAARSVRTMYLLVITGALIASIAAPSFLRRAPRSRARLKGVLP